MSKLSKWLKSAEKAISNVIPHQHSADRRAANQAVSEQIGYYQKQKEVMEAESKQINNDREKEKEAVSKQQIKSMRRNYRSPGFLDEAPDRLTDTLG